MKALELVRDETVKDRTPAPERALPLCEETRKRGLLTGAPMLDVSRADLWRRASGRSTSPSP